MSCVTHYILFRRSNEEECDRRGMWHVWRKSSVGFGCRSQKERDKLEILSADGSV
jgi:hypothetical protein